MSLIEELLHYVRNNIDVLLLLILFALVFFTLTNLYLIYRIKLKDWLFKNQIKAQTKYLENYLEKRNVKIVPDNEKVVEMKPVDKKENDELEEYP